MPMSDFGRDVVLSLAAAAAGSLSLTLAVRNPPEEVETLPVVANLHRAASPLQVRTAHTLGWRPLGLGDAVHNKDAVFTPPGGEGQLLFEDGTLLELDERSLVVIEPPRGGARVVALKQGSVSSRTGGGELTVVTRLGEARLTRGSEAHLELGQQGVTMAVTAGRATVETDGGAAQLASGGRAALGNDGLRELPAWEAHLLEPPPNFRKVFRDRIPAMELAWKNVAQQRRVQLASDRLFAFVSADLPVSPELGRLSIEPQRGVTWWRVVDGQGVPLSEARRFTLFEDKPPSLLAPRDGEVVMVPEGTLASFSWNPVPGVSQFALEVSPSEHFELLTVSEQVRGTHVRLALNLVEGSWYWRVRVAEEGLEARSAPTRFRVIHRAIPKAPELLNPEIEVTPE